jgi:pyruvate ferredoxin oxidoreductase gamma subunit
MFYVRIHGRTGSEVDGTAELLAAAAAATGWAVKVRTEPHWPAGPGWTGVAVAHCLIQDGQARSAPDGSVQDGSAQDGSAPAWPQVDGLIVTDPGLLRRAEVLDGICAETYVLVNSARGFGDLGLSEHLRGQCRDRLMILPAAGLRVVQQDGSLLSAMMAGGFAALAGIIDLASVVAAIDDRRPGPVADGCVSAARAAHDFVRAEREAVVAA